MTAPTTEELPLSCREIRLLLLDWLEQLVKRREAGDVVEMFRNSKRPDVLYLVAIARKPEARAVALKTMEAGG